MDLKRKDFAVFILGVSCSPSCVTYKRIKEHGLVLSVADRHGRTFLRKERGVLGDVGEVSGMPSLVHEGVQSV